jgi:hypothetical protein
MISIDIMGGLGNQLFMIFTTLAYGIRENIKVVYPYDCRSLMGPRHTYWHSFLKDLTVFTTANPDNYINDHQIYNLQRYFEPGFNYNPLPQMTNVVLHGYFQSPKYFDQFKQEIFNIINLFDKQKNIREKFVELFQNSSSVVSMHFRLGDYKEKRLHHAIMNYEYYENALKYIVENSPSVSRVLYCCESEDNEYVGQQISKLQNRFPNIEFFKIPDLAEDYEQMLIMSCCNHNIIANSSFSWWGGYFNQFQEKIVCFPSVWFGEGYNNYNHSDMIPADWTKIQANPKHHSEPL